MKNKKENLDMGNNVYGSIYFVDGTSLKLSWERQESDPSTFIGKVRNAIEKDRFIFETDGDLMIIPVQNIKYLKLSPSPKALPKDLVIKGASIVE
jgi:hypothetical protein